MIIPVEKGPLSIPLTSINNDISNLDPNTGDPISYKLVVKYYTDIDTSNPPKVNPNLITDDEFNEGLTGQAVLIDFPAPAKTGHNYYLAYNPTSDGSSSSLIKLNYRTDYLGSDTYTMFIWYMEDTSIDPHQYDLRYRSHLTSSLPADVCEGSTVGNIGLKTAADKETFEIQFNINTDSVGILIVGITDTDGGGSPI